MKRDVNKQCVSASIYHLFSFLTGCCISLYYLHEKMSSSTLYSSLCGEMIWLSSAAYRTEHSRNFYAALPFQVYFDECLKDRGSRWHSTDIKGWTAMPLVVLEHCIAVCLHASSGDIVLVLTRSISSSEHAYSAVCVRLNLLFFQADDV